MKKFEPADHLHSRTFLGLLVAQFFAAFNDQAIHAAAMFYAINTQVMSERDAISLMPLLFYAPWAIFCTLAGYLADRYSKQHALVIWKVAEVAITLFALYGFWLGRTGGAWNATAGAWIVLACVFLMGMHSAFFVPAKYGVMPEILTPRMISRGNGVLESLSFLAVILGTVFGGVLSSIFRGQEVWIGVILFALAVVGAAASLVIERMPAANPSRPFPPYVYGPLIQNLKALFSSRPLRFTVVGIAFFTFLVAYMRQVVYMHGQSQVPRWDEATTSYIVGVVALGIGAGSPLVGWLSGGKVELGLVPIGAVGMMLATSLAAFFLFNVPMLVLCIAAIGFFTGFYLVPLFSMLQHRAPKTSKGDSIATSNFINITGAMAASAIFFAVGVAAVRTGFTPAVPMSGTPARGVFQLAEYEHGHPAKVVLDGVAAPYKAHEHSAPYTYLWVDSALKVGDEAIARTYVLGDLTEVRFQRVTDEERPPLDKSRLPSLLFLGAGGATLLTILLLWWLLPDLFHRTVLWLQLRKVKLESAGLLRLPGNGPVVLASAIGPGDEARAWAESCLDRPTHFGVSPESAEALLHAGEVVAIDPAAEWAGRLLASIQAPVLPVAAYGHVRGGVRYAYVVAGPLLGPGATSEQASAELARLEADVRARAEAGEALEKEAGEH
jgi:MFS family permease